MTRPEKLALPLLDGVAASALHCPPGAWTSVIDFLAERLPRVERADWLARMERGEVLSEDGQALAPNAPYRANRRLYYYRLVAAEPQIPFEESLVFQDELLLIADKPHFLPVTPKGRYVQQTLLTRLVKRSGIATLSPIHRIDRETAGLVAFAIRPETRDAYQALFRDRAVDKTYEAVAPWRPDLKLPMLYRSRLEEREDAFMQMQEVPGEPNAETRISVIERTHDAQLARYLLEPLSGRKHQLRAQMSALGLAILGDRIYPTLLPEEATPDYRAPLQLLARSLEFTDPITGQRRRFESAQRLALPGRLSEC